MPEQPNNNPNQDRLDKADKMAENLSQGQIINLIEYWDQKETDAQKIIENAKIQKNYLNYTLQKRKLKDMMEANPNYKGTQESI